MQTRPYHLPITFPPITAPITSKVLAFLSALRMIFICAACIAVLVCARA